MEEHIKKIEGLIAENQGMTPRTPWLDISLGGLRTAVEHGKEHVARLNAKEAEASASPGTSLSGAA